MTNHAPAAEYISRINKAQDYIERHMQDPITLTDLAAVAHFSKFHFSRIFSAVCGETPFQFIQRCRLEKAAMLLILNPGESVSEVAARCGFAELPVFSRNFKGMFGLSPTAYRKLKQTNSKNDQIHSKTDQADERAYMYFCSRSNTIKWRTKMKLNKSVEVKKLPDMTLAYIRHTGPYQGNDKLFESLWNKLFGWAGPRGLIGGPDFRSLVIYHDDPNVTIEDKLRMSVCITVPADTKVDGEIGKMQLAEASYVIARFDVDATQFGEAWQWVYGQWFPTSGYQPDDAPCFEMYPEEPKDGRFIVDICVPVKPL